MNTVPLLLLDDDEAFRLVAARGLSRHGFEVCAVADLPAAHDALRQTAFPFALLDLNLNQTESGLSLIAPLLAAQKACRIVILTGYASIQTAIEAIKLGATHYLVKPASIHEIIAAFARTEGDDTMRSSDRPLSVERLAWEHIQKVLAENAGNISATARALGMHRRTLQRKLSKHPVRE